jgi:hypothetical protein
VRERDKKQSRVFGALTLTTLTPLTLPLDAQRGEARYTAHPCLPDE